MESSSWPVANSRASLCNPQPNPANNADIRGNEVRATSLLSLPLWIPRHAAKCVAGYTHSLHGTLSFFLCNIILRYRTKSFFASIFYFSMLKYTIKVNISEMLYNVIGKSPFSKHKMVYMKICIVFASFTL